MIEMNAMACPALILLVALLCVVRNDAKPTSVAMSVDWFASPGARPLRKSASPSMSSGLFYEQLGHLTTTATGLDYSSESDNDLLDATSDLRSQMLTEDGVYWSAAFERQLPHGFSSSDDKKWIERVNSSQATDLLEGCGRMQNRLVIMADGQLSCARHRTNDDQIQGDIYSFLLSRLLGIKNLPPAALVATEQPLWRNVHNQMQSASWQPRKAVVMTQFVHNLSPAYIPSQLRTDKRRLHPQDLEDMNETEAIEAAQWSDLIVFDYLTANLDRVVNNMFNQQWNVQMMASPAHNLVKSSGLLLFVDNESGLFHGFRLLSKYEPYHRKLLDSLCVFRRSTADAIFKLRRDKNIGHLLRKSLTRVTLSSEQILPPLPEKNVRILQERIETVASQITKCRSLYQ
jgi:four-jointed box protein 1